MANTTIDLEQVLTVVEARDPDASALERVTAAGAIASRLELLGQHAVAHFVQEARKAGASWTDIGGALGVTRQAAQQRFVPAGGLDLETATTKAVLPLTDRAAAALTAARDLAAQHHHRGTEDVHLLLALLDSRSSRAVAAVKALGQRAADVRKAGRAHLGAEGPRRAPAAPPFERSTVRALDTGAREALRLDKDAIGTEHLLLALAVEPESSAGQALAEAGVAYAPLRDQVAALPTPSRKRR
jgi:Clp amino terminal domain, pathogenicity island component